VLGAEGVGQRRGEQREDFAPGEEHDARELGSWVPVFGIAIGLDLVVAALAWFVLKPARRAYLGVPGPAVPEMAAPLAVRPAVG
jgi:OFA family oxalate/formate antiporter-like MFS transporter